MAELYIPGDKRIFYKSTGLTPGLHVKVTLFDSNLNYLDTIDLTEVKDIKVEIEGLYFFNYIFYVGIYIAYFYEEVEGVWKKKGVQVYNIREDPEGGSSGFRSSPGNNVINV